MSWRTNCLHARADENRGRRNCNAGTTLTNVRLSGEVHDCVDFVRFDQVIDQIGRANVALH